jgi:hypothetical protein
LEDGSKYLHCYRNSRTEEYYSSDEMNLIKCIGAQHDEKINLALEVFILNCQNKLFSPKNFEEN